MPTIILKYLLVTCLIGICTGFGQFHMRYQNSHRYMDSSEEDNSVSRTYRRCMWEQSKFLPRRLVVLSLCSNLFCENNHLVSRSSCLDILPEHCEQGDEEELMYRPFPDCCPVYCNLKKRLRRLRTMHLRHRFLQNQAASGTGGLLSDYGLNNMNFK